MARIPQSFQQVPAPGGSTAMMVSVPEGAGQTFVAGDLVKRSAGKVVIIAAASDVIFGIARQKASGVTGARVLVEPIRPLLEYEGNLRLATDTFVEGTDNDVAYDIALTGAGNVEISKTTASTAVIVLDTLEKGPDGSVQATQGGPVRFMFRVAKCELST